MRELLKVTSFILRGTEVLLLRHPNAGIQYPAGTIEDGETPAQAALREAREESGLAELHSALPAGEMVETLAEPASLAAIATPMYFRPDILSSSWANIRRGVGVSIERRHGDFAQITYEEFDQVPDPNYVSARITGWVKAETLAQVRRRYFFALPFEGKTEDSWTHRGDNHKFTLFWARVDALPQIISPQDQWTRYLHRFLKGRDRSIR